MIDKKINEKKTNKETIIFALITAIALTINFIVMSLNKENIIIIILYSLVIFIFSFLGFGCVFKIALDMFDSKKKQ